MVKRTTELYYDTYREYSQKGKIDVVAIGKKGVDGLKSKGIKVTRGYIEIYDSLSFDLVNEITQCVLDGYTQGIYDHVELVYNQFKNAAVQNLITEQYLPVNTTGTSEVRPLKGEYRPWYIFEPSMQEIADAIIPQSLKIQFYKAILESVASEHGARMTAMHKATDNAGVLIRELKLQYNQARQASITNEILEIVSGGKCTKRLSYSEY